MVRIFVVLMPWNFTEIGFEWSAITIGLVYGVIRFVMLLHILQKLAAERSVEFTGIG